MVPLGSVRKRLEPEASRPISDHTATGLNATIPDLPMKMEGLNWILSNLVTGCYIGVQDVEDAFPSLPIKEMFWPYMLVVWYNVHDTTDNQLYLYLTVCGDFGVKSLPWIWTNFLRILLRCGEADGIRKPTSSYIDDLTHTSPCLKLNAIST